MNTKQFVRVAMLTALACVLTIVPKVPIGGGYVHFGDCIIYVAAMILGPIPGAILPIANPIIPLIINVGIQNIG